MLGLEQVEIFLIFTCFQTKVYLIRKKVRNFMQAISQSMQPHFRTFHLSKCSASVAVSIRRVSIKWFGANRFFRSWRNRLCFMHGSNPINRVEEVEVVVSG